MNKRGLSQKCNTVQHLKINMLHNIKTLKKKIYIIISIDAEEKFIKIQ